MQYDWQNIDTVLLDMDGTLLDLHFDSHFWLEHLPHAFAQRKNLMLEDARYKISQLMTEHAGTLNWYCVDFWSESLEVDIMLEQGKMSVPIQYALVLMSRPSPGHPLHYKTFPS